MGKRGGHKGGGNPKNEVSSKPLSPQNTQVAHQIIQQEVRGYSGPIPPPEILKKYQDVDGSFPERIMRNWEKQTQQRHNIEDKAVEANIASNTRSQWFAFIIACLAMMIAAAALFLDQYLLGGLFAAFPIAMVALNMFSRIYQWFKKKN